MGWNTVPLQVGTRMCDIPWQVPDLWTCPVNPHLMNISCNIYLFIYLFMCDTSGARLDAAPVGGAKPTGGVGEGAT
jgi:hypothetical protein